MNENLVTALKNELEKSFGRKVVSSRDCLQMVEDIYQKTGYNINSNTLRRFFGLVKTKYTASPSTMTILSKYCGFNSIDEIEKVTESQGAEDAVNSEEVLRFLISLFRDIQVSTDNDKFFYSLVHQTIIFLERNPSLIDRFQREISKTTAGQYYYFEQSVNMDRLNGYYGNGLRYYLRGKNTNEARVFAHSLQVFRYWLANDIKAMEKHMGELTTIIVSQNYPPHILGRFIAAKLYYANIHDDSIERVLAEAKKYNTIIKISHGNSFPDFELIVCEALVLTGHTEEAKDYLVQTKNFFSETAASPFNIWEDILKNKKPNKYNKTSKNNHQNSNSTIHHLVKRYNVIVKHVFSRLQRNKHISGNLQLQELIRETGFTRFYNN